jgi:dTDP-4-amino-4,6-dideoxygalactose transaminase
MKFIKLAYKENYMTKAVTNVNKVEREIPEAIGSEYIVALSAETAVIHMTMKIAEEVIYGKPTIG